MSDLAKAQTLIYALGNLQPSPSDKLLTPSGLSHETKEAEREGFEPPVPLRVHLISNQTQSTNSAISPELERM